MRDDLALLHHDQRIAEHGGMVQIMQRNDAGDGQCRHQTHQTHLMLDVQMVGGLVQEEFLRFLRQGSRDVGTLTFATGHVLPAVQTLVVDASMCHGTFDSVFIRLCPARQKAAVRKSPQFHHIDDTQIGRGAGMLLHESHALRQPSPWHALNILIIEQHPTGKGLSQASQKAQQRRLAGTVRAQQTQRLPLCHLEGHTIDHRLAADLPDQVLGRDADHVRLSSCGVCAFFKGFSHRQVHGFMRIHAARCIR